MRSAAEHPLLVPVRGVDDEHVHAGGGERRALAATSPLMPTAAATLRRPDASTAGR